MIRNANEISLRSHTTRVNLKPLTVTNLRTLQLCSTGPAGGWLRMLRVELNVHTEVDMNLYVELLPARPHKETKSIDHQNAEALKGEAVPGLCPS